jgi:hypothetical protein
MWSRWGLVVGLICLTSCAGLDATSIRSATDESKAIGFRYYEIAPFLFVHSDGKGGLAAEIVWLPDPTREMSIHPYAYIASNDATLSFTNGVLTEAKAVGDETQVAGAALDSLSKFLATVGPGLNAVQEQLAKKPPEAPPPYLYKIVVTGDGITLRGGPPDGVVIRLPATATGS